MNRRQLIALPGAIAVGSVAARGAASAASPTRALMKLGGTGSPYDAANLRWLLRYGVKNIVASPRIAGDRLYATAEELKQMRELPDKLGVSIDVLTPPFLASSHIDREKHPAIMLGSSPDRDRDIEAMQTMIRSCAAAGIPAIKYNMSILGVLRNLRGVAGRGDSQYGGWRLKDAKADPPLTRAGRVTEQIFWERITYYLERVIPVAEEYKIRMACHPQDPGVGPEGYQGVNRVLGSVEGLKKFLAIKESPYHGLNFCQGTLSEDLQNPAKEITDVIRYFGSRKKIFNVHFRNIRGRRDDFLEVWPDEGDVDMFAAMQAYKEVGYPYLIQPDHLPSSPSDPNARPAGEAFQYGYIRGLIQAVDRVA